MESVNEIYSEKLNSALKKLRGFTAEVVYQIIDSKSDNGFELIENWLKSNKKDGHKVFPAYIGRDGLKKGTKIPDNFKKEYKVYLGSKSPRLDSETNNVLKARIRDMEPSERRDYFHYLIVECTDTQASLKMLFHYNDTPDRRDVSREASDLLCQTGASSKLQACLKKVIDIRNVHSAHTNGSYVYEKTAFEKDLDTIKQLSDLFDTSRLSDRSVKAKDALMAYIDEWKERIQYPPISKDDLEKVEGFDEGTLHTSYLNSRIFGIDPSQYKLYWTSKSEVEEYFLSCQQDREIKASWLKVKEVVHASEHQDRKPVELSNLAQEVQDRPLEEVNQNSLEVQHILENYKGGMLSESQLKDLLIHSVVMADKSFWGHNQSFLMNEVARLLAQKNRCMIVDWSTRVELYRIETGTEGAYTSKEIRNAKRAHNYMTLMERVNRLVYMNPEEQVTSSPTSILNIAEKNPADIFVVFTEDGNMKNMAEERNLSNVITMFYSRITKKCGIRRGSRLILHQASGREESQKESKGESSDKELKKDTHKHQIKFVEQKRKKSADNGQSPNPLSPIISDGTLLTCSEMPVSGDIVHDNENKTIHLTGEIGSGGEGIVYGCDLDNRVVKLYHKNQLTQARKDKLEYMVQHNPQIRQLCWPEKLVFNKDHEFVGYVMRDATGYQEFGRTVLKLNSPAVRSNTMWGWDRKSLVLLCRNLCRTFSAMHRRGIYMGDVNPRNMMVNPKDTQGKDYVFVDCDSYQIDRYPCPVGTAVFTSPKLYKREGKSARELVFGSILRTESDELYAIASVFFHILMLNQSPFAGKNETNIEKAMMNYNFAYRVTRNDEVEVDGSDTPDGPSRMIWNNTPKYIKDLFAREFKDAGDVPLADWEKNLGWYLSDIGKNIYTTELEPKRYWDLPTDDPNKKYNIEFKCDECGTEENMPKRRYEWEEKRHYPHLCQKCRTMGFLLKEQSATEKCECCGKTYDTTKWDVYMIMGGYGFAKPICPECRRTVPVPCASCGKTVSIPKWRLEKNRQHGWSVHCDDCKKLITVQCRGCGRTINMQTWWFDHLRRQGKDPYCDDCRKRIFGR